VIFLREGIEASMIVAILLAYLDRTGQRRHFRDVIAGVVIALGLITAAGVVAYLLIDSYNGSRPQTIFETVTYLIAATALTYMTFWMQSHARTMTSELQARSDLALNRGARVGLGVLAAQAVGREGLETMVFTLAIVFASKTNAPAEGSRWLLLGGIAGLAVALGIAVWIYKLGHRLNLAKFFLTMGVLLMIFAAGFIADAVQNMQELGWLPSGQGLWNSSGVIAEDSTVGDLLHALLGYADRPSALQVIAWALYLGIAVTAFVRRSNKGRARRYANLPPA
jgi:high-affinity iron transporter